MDKTSIKIDPGEYKTYIAPAGVSDIIDMFSWGGISESSLQQKDSALLKMRNENIKLSPCFTLKEDFSNGMVPRFNDEGEISVLGLVAITEEVMKLKINYKITSYPKEYPPDEPQRRCPDISNAKKNLNYFPKISLREGLKVHFTWSKNFLQN